MSALTKPIALDETLQRVATALEEISETTGDQKADKVQNAVAGNFAGLDETGNLTDSGHKPSDYLTAQDIEGKLDAPATAGTSGQLLRVASGGGTEWSDVGAPTDAQVDTAVSTWLGNHPEATTTVQDGSITKVKLDSSLQQTVDEVGDLKSAINVIDNNIVKGLTSKETGTAYNINNGYIDNSGEYHINSGYKSYSYSITPGKYDKLTATGANNANSPKNISFITFIHDGIRTPAYLITSSDANIHTETADVPAEATIVVICVAKNYVDTYGTPKVDFLTINSITEAAKKEETIIAENIGQTYLSHRFISPNTYLPTSTTSSGWDLYKLNVDGIDEVLIRTYFKSGASSALPFWTIVNTDFDDVTATNQTSENIVSHDKKHSPTNNVVEIHAKIPVGGKTMLLCCATDQASNFTTIAYKYHFFKSLEFVNDVPMLDERTSGLIVMKQSQYYRDVRWGCPCFDKYYHSEDNGTSEFPSSTTAAQYFAKFNTLVSDYSGYAESHEMGLASDESTTMYYYTFTPLTNQDSTVYKRPKIIISAGQHGFEKTACFGLYWFIKNLLEDWQDNSFLAYVRNHVQLIVMPLLNPWGFDNDKYVNANGVNLNRNWDTEAWSKGTAGTTTYGGESPLDQPETQYASAVILNNLDALWLCDYHNNGQAAPSGATGYLWHSFALVTYDDPYFAKSINAAKWHIDEITGHLYIDYPTICEYVNSGNWTDNNAPSHQGLIVAYAREHNIMAETMEGGAAFIDSGSRYTSPIHHMNADLIGNWIRCILATYAHYAE